MIISLSSIPLSQYRKYHSLKRQNVSKVFEDKDGKKVYRLYLPFAYVEKQDIKAPKNLEIFLEQNGYTVVNYINGLCSKNERIFKIGRILTKIGTPIASNLLKLFNEDPQRSGKSTLNNQFTIVISRHPYDIASSAQGRLWEKSSCLRFSHQNSSYISSDIEEGSLIAYLIDNKDLNIQHPVARLILKPYFKQTEKGINKKDCVWFPQRKVYGVVNEIIETAFRKACVDWCDAINGVGKNKTKVYLYRLSEDVYNDSDQSSYVVGNKESVKAIIKCTTLNAIKQLSDDVFKNIKLQEYQILATHYEEYTSINCYIFNKIANTNVKFNRYLHTYLDTLARSYLRGDEEFFTAIDDTKAEAVAKWFNSRPISYIQKCIPFIVLMFNRSPKLSKHLDLAPSVRVALELYERNIYDTHLEAYVNKVLSNIDVYADKSDLISIQNTKALLEVLFEYKLSNVRRVTALFKLKLSRSAAHSLLISIIQRYKQTNRTDYINLFLGFLETSEYLHEYIMVSDLLLLLNEIIDCYNKKSSDDVTKHIKSIIKFLQKHNVNVEEAIDIPPKLSGFLGTNKLTKDIIINALKKTLT